MKKITKNEKFGKLENGISCVIGHSSGKCPIVCFSWNDDTTFILFQKLNHFFFGKNGVLLEIFVTAVQLQL